MISTLLAAGNSSGPSVVDWVTHPRALVIKLSLDRTFYSLRDDIRVKVVLGNDTPAAVTTMLGPAWGSPDIEVIDSAGHHLARPNGRPNHTYTSSGRPNRIAPGDKVALRGLYGDYTPIKYWGYDMISPGIYTVVAICRLSNASVRSNTMTIRVH